MKWGNQLTQTLKVDYPVIQAPMLGFTTPEMVAAISNQRGLGSLPVGGLSPEKTLELIRKTKALTPHPFAINLFSHTIPKPDKQKCARMQELLEKICLENGIAYKKQSLEDVRFYNYTEQVECILNENIPIVSFTFGALDTQTIKTFKQRGVTLIGTATSLKEAQLLDNIGINMIAAQGIEAGGHRGTFLENEPLPMVSAMQLVSQLTRHINKPIIAAGGINTGETIKAAFALGAQGVQIGTAFIASEESSAIPSFKSYLKHSTDNDSVLTKAFSGRWARGLKNKFIAEVEASGLEIPPYPIQNSLTAPLRNAAQQNNNKEFTNLWAGLGASKAETKPIAELFLKLIRQAEETE